MLSINIIARFFIVSLFLFPSVVSASEIVLKSGQRIEGNIVGQTDKYVKIDAGIGMAVTYYRDEIDKIDVADGQKPQDPPPPELSLPGWDLVWDDEFKGASVDPRKWSFEIGNGDNGWSNGQLDYATSRPENVQIRDGKLVLTVRKEEYQGFHYTSSRMFTKGKVNFRYGRIEIRAKAMYSNGIGLAFWLLGSNFQDPDWTWPKCGEIDVLEISGRHPGFVIGTAHYYGDSGHHISQGSYILPDGKKFSEDYHTFSVEWDENKIDWFVDSVRINTLDISQPFNGRKPFNNQFFLILNTIVGGNYWGAPDDTSVFPMTAYVDWVRVYKRKGGS